MTCHLYRHYDSAGALLYVGIAKHVGSRLAQHQRLSSWADQIARVDLVAFPSRTEAEVAERVAVANERPIHNRHFTTPGVITDVTSLIDTWPTRRCLAEEIGASNVAVHRWAERNSISSGWMLAVVRAAQARGMAHITAEWMLTVHADASAELHGEFGRLA